MIKHTQNNTKAPRESDHTHMNKRHEQKKQRLYPYPELLDKTLNGGQQPRKHVPNWTTYLLKNHIDDVEPHWDHYTKQIT